VCNGVHNIGKSHLPRHSSSCQCLPVCWYSKNKRGKIDDKKCAPWRCYNVHFLVNRRLKRTLEHCHCHPITLSLQALGTSLSSFLTCVHQWQINDKDNVENESVMIYTQRKFLKCECDSLFYKCLCQLSFINDISSLTIDHDLEHSCVSQAVTLQVFLLGAVIEPSLQYSPHCPLYMRKLLFYSAEWRTEKEQGIEVVISLSLHYCDCRWDCTSLLSTERITLVCSYLCSPMTKTAMKNRALCSPMTKTTTKMRMCNPPWKMREWHDESLKMRGWHCWHGGQTGMHRKGYSMHVQTHSDRRHIQTHGKTRHAQHVL
jgi:hypothetical protein